MPEFRDIQDHLVDTLLMDPSMMWSVDKRSSLLQGIPLAPIVRSQSDGRLDLNNIVYGLNCLGRLRNGARPLFVVIDNALRDYRDGGEIYDKLTACRGDLAAYYDAQAQPPLPTTREDEIALEALVFGRYRDTRLSYAFILGAERTARSVTRLTVPRIIEGRRQQDFVLGTGWLISKGIVLTNHHVISARERNGEPDASAADMAAQAESTESWFDYFEEAGVEPLKCRGARLLASNPALDYALIELAEPEKVTDREALPVQHGLPSLLTGSRMNIAQHSLGGPLQFAIRNNFFVRCGDKPEFIRYQTDTEPGASGSPVCDDTWRVIGLHHASRKLHPDEAPSAVPQEVIEGQPLPVRILNEAVTMYAIVNDSQFPAAVRQNVLTR